MNDLSEYNEIPSLDLADFLIALRRVDPADGPRPGLHNRYRGGTLRTYRLAVAATGEYTSFHGGQVADASRPDD